jgi:DNA-binding MarR family transcriptional regulator
VSELPTIDAIERIVVAGVAMTNAALAGEAGTDLTFPQWRVLVILGSAPDGLPVAEISRRISVTLPATGRQLRRLEHRGLVRLEPDAHDRRVTRATLTDAGVDRRGAIMAQRRARIEGAVSGIDVSPDGVAAVDRIAAAMERDA